MNKTMPMAAAVAAAALLTSSTAGAGATVFIHATCAQYVEQTAGLPDHAYNWFVAGFVSGTNMVRDRGTSGDAASYRVWLSNYCQKNPFDNFVTALSRLDKYLGEGRDKVIVAPSPSNSGR